MVLRTAIALAADTSYMHQPSHQEFYDKDGKPILQTPQAHVTLGLIAPEDADKAFSVAAWLMARVGIFVLACVFGLLPLVAMVAAAATYFYLLH